MPLSDTHKFGGYWIVLKIMCFGIALPIVWLVAEVLYLRFAPDWLKYWSEMRNGNRIIALIESYQDQFGHPPDDLEQLGVNNLGMMGDSQGVYYRKSENNNYVVWFGTTLGESVSYCSEVNKWTPVDSCP